MTEAKCFDDLSSFGEELNDPLEELAQDRYHAIIEPPGSNIDDPNRGYGLEGKLSLGLAQDELSSTLKFGLEAEMLKEGRISAASATLTKTADREYEVKIAMVADEGELGITLVRDGNGVRRVA